MEFSCIDFNVAAGSFKISGGEKFSIDTVGIKQEYFKHYIENDILYVKYIPGPFSFIFPIKDMFSPSGEINITLPEKIYNNINIKVTGGDLNIENLNSNKVSVNMTAGNASLNNINALSSLKISITAGNMDYNESKLHDTKINMTAGVCNFNNCLMEINSFSVTAGHINTEGCTLTGKNKISSTAGVINLKLLGNINDYSFNNRQTAGNINIWSNDKYENHQNDGFTSPNTFDINVTAGDCNIYFN